MSYCPQMYQGVKPYRIFVWYLVDARRTFRRCEACFSLMRGALFLFCIAKVTYCSPFSNYSAMMNVGYRELMNIMLW